MPNELTSLKLQAAALEIERMRLEGVVPPNESFPRAEFARLAGVSEETIRAIELILKARLARSILQDPHSTITQIKRAQLFLSKL